VGGISELKLGGAPTGTPATMNDNFQSDVRDAEANANDAAFEEPDFEFLNTPVLPQRMPRELRVGYRLQEYRIEEVVGRDAFSVLYLCMDENLKARVFIKEYMPEQIAFRTTSGTVMPNAKRNVKTFLEGLKAFLEEGRMLAGFRHPAIDRVIRAIELRGTAYMVFEYSESLPLTEWWPAHRSIGEESLVALLHPLLDGLAAIHAAGFLHRDIKPRNIRVRADDGQLVLAGFGSAGKSMAVGDQGKVVVSPGYSPIEQYRRGEQVRATDLYALGATLYWAVTGSAPADVQLRRSDPRVLVPAKEVGRGQFGEAFLGAIDSALEMEVASRPQSVEEFRRALFADHGEALGLQEVLARDGLSGGAQRSFLGHLFSPRDWRLSLKMTMVMVATALLPMLITTFYNLQGTVDAVTKAELRYVEQMAHSAAGRVGQLITDSRHFARSLGTDREYATFLAHPDEAGKAAMRAKVERVAVANPDVHLIMLMNAAGVAVVSSDPAVMGRNFAFREYFKEAIAGRPFASGMVVGAVAGAAGMFFAEPVKEGDKVIGAIVLRIRASSFASILDQVRHDPSLTPFLVDADGVLIYHPKEPYLYHSLMPLSTDRLEAIRTDQRFRRDSIENLNMPELAQAMVGARANGTVSYQSTITKQPEIAGFAPVPGHNWMVGVAESRTEFEEPLKQLYNPVLLSVVLIGMLFTGLALVFARTITRPIGALTAAVKAIQKGEFDHVKVPPGGRDELGQLTRTFNVMINVLRRRERERHGR
jgi:serine/threonine protein kinase/HAMP domain-containing protein